MNRNNNVRLADRDLEFILCEIKARFMKKNIIKYYENDSKEEIQEIVEFLRNNSIEYSCVRKP